MVNNEKNEQFEKELKKYNKKKEERKKAGIEQSEPISVIPNDEKAEPVKKKRTTRRRKKKTTVESESIEKLLMTVTGVIATRPNMKVWEMQPKEAKAIAEPLAEVLDKYNLASGIAENSAEISLVIASLSFVAPRVLITVSQRKEKKKDGMDGKSATGSTGRKLEQTRKSEVPKRTSTRTSRDSSSDKSSNVEYGIFGNPL